MYMYYSPLSTQLEVNVHVLWSSCVDRGDHVHVLVTSINTTRPCTCTDRGESVQLVHGTIQLC